MATYKYRARKGTEGVVEGSIEALSEREGIEKLSQMGYLPIYLDEVVVANEHKPAPVARMRGRVPQREITLFSRQLASLLKSGVPILTAINVIKEQSENANLKIVLERIYDAVKDGNSFSSVLEQYPNIFPPLYLAMIHTGENSGALPEVLLRIADYRTRQEEMISRFRMAMAYPLLMAVVGVSTIIFMLTFVMPRLMNIFMNMGQTLPLPTRMLISISGTLRQNGFWILIVLTLAILILRRQANTKAGKISISAFKLHLPVFGKFVVKAELARFCRTLELLLKNGVSILKAIEVAIPVMENEIIKNQLAQSLHELEHGGSFGKSLKNSKIVPLFMSNLINIGEESGKLDEALQEIVDSYERDTDETMKIMSSLMEPVMILVMGLIVGFIVIAMLLPIFEMNMAVR